MAKMSELKIGTKVKSVTSKEEGIVEQGDRRGSPEPSWARGCVMVRFGRSSDAVTTPAANLELI